MIPESAGFVRRFALQENREPCQQERERVGGIVPGVRNQGEAVSADSRDQFDPDECDRGCQRPAEDAARRGSVRVRMQKEPPLPL